MPDHAENVVSMRGHGDTLRVVTSDPAPLRERGDEDLMLAFCDGDETAFAELLRRHQRGILNYIFRMVQNRHVAEEITQEVFTALVKNTGRYRPTAKFTTYLYTIASNLVAKEWSRQKRRPRLFNLTAFWNRDREDEGIDPIERQRDETANVVQGLERAEISDAANAALKHLPAPQREAFVLRRLQDLSYEETAEVLDVPVGTVKSRIVRAERALRPHLERFREYL